MSNLSANKVRVCQRCHNLFLLPPGGQKYVVKNCFHFVSKLQPNWPKHLEIKCQLHITAQDQTYVSKHTWPVPISVSPHPPWPNWCCKIWDPNWPSVTLAKPNFVPSSCHCMAANNPASNSKQSKSGSLGQGWIEKTCSILLSPLVIPVDQEDVFTPDLIHIDDN